MSKEALKIQAKLLQFKLFWAANPALEITEAMEIFVALEDVPL